MSSDADFLHEPSLRAGKYVLGLGDATERIAIEREMESDATLEREVAYWERRLRPLLIGFRPMPPPPELWERLSRSAFGEKRLMTTLAWPSVRSRLAAGAVGFTLAAGIAVAVLLGSPLLFPRAPIVPVAALVPKTAGAPVLVVWRDPEGGLLVQSIGMIEAPAGKGYELWSLSPKAKRPAALGMLRDGKAAIAASRTPVGAGLILVSLEAHDGSPSGLPQGPVLWSGAFAGGG